MATSRRSELEPLLKQVSKDKINIESLLAKAGLSMEAALKRLPPHPSVIRVLAEKLPQKSLDYLHSLFGKESAEIIKSMSPEEIQAYEEGLKEGLERILIRAEMRRRVIEAAFAIDHEKPREEQDKIIDRQIRANFEYKQDREDVRGHVDVIHALPPDYDSENRRRSKKGPLNNWALANKTSSFETGIGEIAAKAFNNVLFKRHRLHTDPNSLGVGEDTSILIERKSIAKRSNVNALKAQRDVTKRMMEGAGAMEDGVLKKPYFAIFLHGKVDTRGADFEIAACEKEWIEAIDPAVAFWFADELGKTLKEKDIKNKEDKFPTINVVTSPGAYSGSRALHRMRNGDNLFEFNGFGKMFQALQLEVGKHLRDNYPTQLTEILNELMEKFSATFQTGEAIEAIDVNKRLVENKLREKERLAEKMKEIYYDNSVGEGQVALSAAMRGFLEVEVGEMVKIGGLNLEVRLMKQNWLKKEFEVAMNPKHKPASASDASS